VVGIALGLYFGYVVGLDGSLAALASFGLVIVPIVIWISPKRPLLGWQLPIISFAICSVLTHPDYPGQPFDLPSDLLMAVMEWTGLLILSSPWGLLLLRRAQEARSVGEKSVGDVKRYALAVGLIVVSGLLMLSGWAMVFAPDSSGWAAAGGILLGTIGIAVCLSCDRVASRLGNARADIRQFMVAALVVSPGMALGGGHHGSQISAGRSSVIFGSMLGIESLTVLLWLFLTRLRARVGLPDK
jgi:hypothetical protein